MQNDTEQPAFKRYHGKIKFYKHGYTGERGRGYGFLTADKDGHEYFFHYRGLRDCPIENCDPGVRITFELRTNSKKQTIAIEIDLENGDGK